MTDTSPSVAEILAKSSLSSGIEIHRVYKKHQRKQLQKQKEHNLRIVCPRTIDFLVELVEKRLPNTHAVMKAFKEKRVTMRQEIFIELFAECEEDKKAIERHLDEDFESNVFQLENS